MPESPTRSASWKATFTAPPLSTTPVPSSMPTLPICEVRITGTLGFVKDSENRAMYKRMVDRIQESLKFVEVCGVSQFEDLRRVDLFTCHEGLNLDYEEALTRLSPSGNGYYNLGAPFLWIGDRTRQLDHAHVEYFRGIQNPIGCKVGPTMKPAELVGLILTLCPDIKSGLMVT